MKKTMLLLAAIVSFGATVSSAQSSRLFLGLDFTHQAYYTHNKSTALSDDPSLQKYAYSHKYLKTRDGVFIPSINYMITDKWAVGLGGGYSYGKYGYLNRNEDGESSVEFSRSKGFIIESSVYHFTPIARNLYYTPTAYVNFSMRRSKTAHSHYYLSDRTLSAGIYLVSFEYRIRNRIGINLSYGAMNYAWNNYPTRESEDYRNSTKYHTFKFNMNSVKSTFRFYI